MDKFLDLLRESVIVQSVVTLVLVITLCVMFVIGRPIPDLLAYLASLIVGYWFGSKSQYLLSRSKPK